MKRLRTTARPGDLFILLFPTEAELPLLRRYQSTLQAQYGGRIYEELHITVQRFAPSPAQKLPDVLQALTSHVAQVQAFPIFAAALAQFYAAFWGTYVLRWRIQETPAWRAFRSQVETLLQSINCPPHYPSAQASTCSALETDDAVSLAPCSELSFPCYLFTARHIVISRMERPGQFEHLASVMLRT